MNDRYIVHFISRTRKKMLNFIKEKLIEENLDGLIPSHGNVLTALYENNGKLTMKKIAEITKKDKSTITPLINKLLELGYIIKVKDEKDKKGKEIKGKYNTISNEVYNTAYKNFSEEEKEIFLKLLKKMNNNFNSNS
jgi:MarR family transcriptional regulator, organic hydroperoxide resistance regulator